MEGLPHAADSASVTDGLRGGPYSFAPSLASLAASVATPASSAQGPILPLIGALWYPGATHTAAPPWQAHESSGPWHEVTGVMQTPFAAQ